MHADKFTIPLINWLIKEFGEQVNQHFLLLDAENIDLPTNGKYTILKHPLKKHIFSNSYQIIKCFKNADKTIMHGNPLLFYFFIFNKFIKQLGWVIYGGVDMENLHSNSINLLGNINQKIKRHVLRKVSFHYTHIEGDSIWCNQNYRSKAKFIYSPIYLSNIPDLGNFSSAQNIIINEPINLLVGSSNDSSNNHIEIFGWLKEAGNTNLNIYCPLSYGGTEQYKLNVKKVGHQYFGERFIALDHFMQYDEYQTFLHKIHLAIFNHKRQEGMGVTLSLLGNGKLVYMNSNTTAFESFTNRGFIIFDNKILQRKDEIYKIKKIQPNKELLNKYYSFEALKNSWINIFNNLYT